MVFHYDDAMKNHRGGYCRQLQLLERPPRMIFDVETEEGLQEMLGFQYILRIRGCVDWFHSFGHSYFADDFGHTNKLSVVVSGIQKPTESHRRHLPSG